MNFDAFSNNIEPGGLRNRTEIKIFICYLLTSVPAPLTRGQINAIVGDYGIANFFEVNDALDSLTETGVITVTEPDCFTGTEKAKTVADALDVSLPFTVRQQAVDAAMKLLAKIKRESDNIAEIKKNDDGYSVVCRVMDNGVCLMGLEIYVADILQAEHTKQYFLDNATKVYKDVISSVTGTEDI